MPSALPPQKKPRQSQACLSVMYAIDLLKTWGVPFWSRCYWNSLANFTNSAAATASTRCNLLIHRKTERNWSAELNESLSRKTVPFSPISPQMYPNPIWLHWPTLHTNQAALQAPEGHRPLIRVMENSPDPHPRQLGPRPSSAGVVERVPRVASRGSVLGMLGNPGVNGLVLLGKS